MCREWNQLFPPRWNSYLIIPVTKQQIQIPTQKQNTSFLDVELKIEVNNVTLTV